MTDSNSLIQAFNKVDFLHISLYALCTEKRDFWRLFKQNGGLETT